MASSKVCAQCVGDVARVDRGIHNALTADLERERQPATKTLQLCDQGAPVCSPGGLDRAAHSAYATNGTADQAAQFVVTQLGQPAPIAAQNVSSVTEAK